MSITIELDVLAWSVIFCIAVIIGVLLIILIRKCLRVMDKVNKIIDENAKSIKETIEVLPSAIKSVDGVASSAKETLDKANSVVATVEDTVADTIESFSFNVENVLSIINIASTVFKSILSSFSGSKK